MPKLIVFNFENLDSALNLTFATLKKYLLWLYKIKTGFNLTMIYKGTQH